MSRPAAVAVLLASSLCPAGARAQASPPAAAGGSRPGPAAAFAAYEETIPGPQPLRFRMLPIEGGKLLFGSPDGEPGRGADEGPQVEVTVSPFWMGRCEVTWDEYDRWSTDASLKQSKQPDGTSRPTPAYTDMTLGMGREGGYPAIGMTNEAARQYCIWLSKQTGRFYRLPTEAEWEYACRAGSRTAYSFGDDARQLAEHAWFEANSDKAYHKVGLKPPNAFGLCDMHGNVSEWCCDALVADFHARLARSDDRRDPYAVPHGKDGRPFRYPHVVRGGSWMDPGPRLRSAARRGSEPAWKQRDPQLPQSAWYFTDAPFVGFRVVRPLREPDAAERARYEMPR